VVACLYCHEVPRLTYGMKKRNFPRLKSGGNPGGGYFLMWPIRGCAAGQGMVFGLSVLNRLCDFVRVCPKQRI